jgi:phosphoribosylaminoimidazole-succinocarboxamide synthase
MNKGIEIARGKTKVLYEYPGQPDQLIVAQTDGISSGDGARKDVIAGKGRLAAQTTARVFRLLVPRLIEFFVKDDANHDPMIAPEQIVAQGIANPNEVAAMSEMARLTFDILAHAWRKRDVLLVDLKIEFGRLTGGENKGQLVIADVIDNDSWRIWRQGREDMMLDKQMYRNLPDVDDAGLARVKDAYERVADLVGTFPVMRPGMAAVITDHNDRIPRTNEVVTALAQLGLPTVRHIASPATTPGYVLQLVQQLEATFARLLFVAVDENGALRQMLDAASSSPVMDGNVASHRLTMEIAKLLGVEDTVLYGRTLLMQANARSAVIHADAALQQQVPPGVKLG